MGRVNVAATGSSARHRGREFVIYRDIPNGYALESMLIGYEGRHLCTLPAFAPAFPLSFGGRCYHILRNFRFAHGPFWNLPDRTKAARVKVA
jgi:hypothetical protein